MTFHYGDVFERLAPRLPARAPALLHESRRADWGELRARTNRLARALLAAGLEAGDKVAHYLRNHPAYLETFIAASKARLVHVNVNYRYQVRELAYLLDNSDARAVVYGADFAPLVAELMPRFPGMRLWIEVGDGEPALAGAASFERLASEGDDADLALARPLDDLHLIYTGGTTGMPKGVMWRHGDLWIALGGGGSPSLGIPPPPDLETHLRNVEAGGFRPVQMPLNPLMHGAALMTAVTALVQGGCVVTVGGARFDAPRALDALQRHRVTNVCLVGDAFARPLLEALDTQRGRWDLSSLKVIVSTGAMWSQPIKEGLLRHAPQAVLYDALGSTESVGYGFAHATRDGAGATARFKLGPEAKVLTPDLREVWPGSPEPGYIARRGPVPIGYYKDPERSARTFPVIDGVRYAIPGDLCRLDADGTATLLGRGSGCINTGGEKVFAEEVEECLKRHAQVRDAIVVGLPSERWGQAVTGVVELRDGAALDEAQLRAHVRSELADYKVPKRIVAVPDLRRAPNGKPDYAFARAAATEQLERIERNPMAANPETDLSRFPYLTGNYAPVERESTFTHEELRIEGDVPRDLIGAFMRNGPNTAFAPNHYVYPLDGDGMVHAVYFDGGRVSYRNRWVRTAAFNVERKLGRRIYGSIGRPNPVPPEAIAAGGDPSPYKNTANTNILAHGGKLLALWEVGLPHLMTPALDTVGPYRYEGALQQGQNLSAHPKICPTTGELVSCSQHPFEPKWTAMIFGADGRLVRRFTVDLLYKAVLHDLQITARYIVLLCGPAVSNPALAAQGRLPVEWRANEPMRIAVIPRDGTAPARWFETPAFFSWHFCNGFEQGEDVIVDYIWIASIPIAQEQGTGIEGQPRRMHRVRIDMRSGTVSNERVSEIFCEFPRVDDRRCGLPYRYGYAAASTMTKKGEHHGYNCTARFDFATGEVRVHEHGPAANAGEPVCIPKPGRTAEQDIYVMAFVTNPPDATRRDYDSELAIFDGAGFASGPLARIHIPARVPNGFHANWMEGMRLPA